MTLANAFVELSMRKAWTSCGVGGRPVRSKVARRMSVRLSAVLAGGEIFLFEFLEDEIVDWVFRPFSVSYVWNFGAGWGSERPPIFGFAIETENADDQAEMEDGKWKMENA